MSNTTVCFSGYRPEKFAFIMNKGEEAYLSLEKRIEEAILTSINEGYNTFICGMAKGFDLVAGCIVVTLKESWAELADINLIAVLPFENHGFKGNPWHILLEMVLGRAASIVSLSAKYHTNAYHERNCYMVNNSSRLICYYNGQRGGTDHTVRYAQKKELEIINVY